MIDPHIAALTAISTPLRAAYAGIVLYPEEVTTPAAFPCVTVQQIDNYETARSLSNTENAAVIELQLDLYSNKQTGNLTERQGMAAVIDTVLRALKYNRTFYNSNMPNIELTIKRSTMRYKKLAV